ncbi:hypothetical protein CRYUN_Cryun16bG0072700 [Craigia yunnanensis]
MLYPLQESADLSSTFSKNSIKKVPDSLVKLCIEDGFNIKYIPWHIVNQIMNPHAPEWFGEVCNITYSADGKSVSIVYRVTLYGMDAEYLELDAHVGGVNGLAFSHPNKQLCVITCGDDRTIKVWDHRLTMNLLVIGARPWLTVLMERAPGRQRK